MDEEGEKLVTVVINDMEKFQFYATNDHFKTFFQDDNALFNTVKSAFEDGIAVSEIIQKVEDLQSVKLDHYESCGPITVCEASEVCEVDEEGAVRCEMEAPTEGEYESIQIIAEETTLENLTSSGLPEELIMDGGLSSDERLNLCAYCDYRTFNVGHFKIHMRQHTGESPFECNFCDYRSKQKSNLKRHMRQHIEGKDHFECKMCSFTCSQEKVYKRHMILHTRSRPLRPCPFCDYFSTSLAHLTVHIRQHTGETPYHCGLCPYKTVQKSNLTRHLKKHRRGRISKADKLRCCLYCSYRTPNPAHLLAHIRAAHTGETPYACQHCSYKSAQRSNLKRHLRKHTGERPYKCNLCSYSTAYPYVLKKHIENHPSPEEKLQCDFCEFFTYSTMEFRKHGKYHVENDSLLCCHICGSLSVNSDKLKAHMRIHSLDKPFKCHYCSYGSIQKSNLKRHLLHKHYGVSQIDELNKTSNSEEGVLQNKKKEIMNVDSSNSGTLPEDKLHQSYIDASGEEILECNESNTRKEEIEKDQTYHTDPAYLNDYSNNAEVVENDVQSSYDNENENEHDTETVEVISEEHVITTPMEGYEVSEDYDEGSAGENTTDEVERSPKKNLSFLNKLQAEKLKEFKRLLQQGTQSAQSGLSSSRSQTEENRRHNSSAGEVDNAAENTESCTEEPPLEEEHHDPPRRQGTPEKEFHRSNIAQDNGNDNIHNIPEEQSISCRQHNPHFMSRRIPENVNQRTSHVVEGPTLIVDHDDEGNLEYDEFGSEYNSHVCKLCEFAAETLLELKNHIGVHTGETTAKGYFCDLCPFKSIREIDISRHKNLFHGASPPKRLPFVCGICEYRTGSKEDFLEHNRRHKGDPFRCKICEKKLANAEEYKHHAREHIGEEPFECYYCAYLTARKCHLRRHMRKHEGTLGGKGPPPYKCYTCGFNTDHRAEFLKHTGTHKIQQSVRYTCPHCLFMTLDEEVLNIHKKLHERDMNKEDDSNDVKSIGEQPMLSKNILIKKERIPLKEWMINVPETEEMTVKNVLVKRPFDKSTLYKHKLKEDYSSISPVKRRRKNLRSLTNCSGTSVVEARLTKKFKFNIKNLCSSAETDPGYSVDFFGEVLKSHGSLRKYTNYAEIYHKSENEMTTVLSNVENDEELKRVYAKFKDVMLSHKNSDQEILSFQFTIYFKEIDEIIKTPDETFSDLDISLSSGDESDQNSINDLDSSDLDLDDLSPSNTPRSSAVENKPDSPLESSKPIVTTKVSKAPDPLRKDSNSEFVFNLDRADKVKFLQDKIKERNERMKELRRLKALSGFPRDVKKEINGLVPKTEPIVEPVEEDADDGRLVIEE